jgi:hypothetical protein
LGPLGQVPELPDGDAPHHAEEIAWRVRQLEDSWRSLNNPMNEAQAQALCPPGLE